MTHNYLSAFPKCQNYDCFFCNNGECRVLSNNNFNGGVCHTYKTREEYYRERVQAGERVKAINNIPMIEKYYGSYFSFREQLDSDKAELKKILEEK